MRVFAEVLMFDKLRGLCGGLHICSTWRAGGPTVDASGGGVLGGRSAVRAGPVNHRSCMQEPRSYEAGWVLQLTGAM